MAPNPEKNKKPDIQRQAPQVPKSVPTPKLPVADKLRQCLNLKDPEKAKKQINQILDRERGHLGDALNIMQRSSKLFEGFKKSSVDVTDIIKHEVVKLLIRQGDKKLSRLTLLALETSAANYPSEQARLKALNTIKLQLIEAVQNGIKEHKRIIDYRLAMIHRTKNFINENLNEAMTSTNKHEKTTKTQLQAKYRELLKLFCETHVLFSLFFDQLPNEERMAQDNRLKELRTQLENIRNQIQALQKEQQQKSSQIEKDRALLNKRVKEYQSKKQSFENANKKVNDTIKKYDSLSAQQNKYVALAEAARKKHNAIYNPFRYKEKRRLKAEYQKYNSLAAKYKAQRNQMSSEITKARTDKKSLATQRKSLESTRIQIAKDQADLTKREAALRKYLTTENARLNTEQQKILDELAKKNIHLLTETKRQQVLKASDSRLNRIETLLSKLDTSHNEYLSYRSAPEAMRKWFERTQNNYDVISKGILGLPPALRNNYCDQMLKTFQQFEDIHSGKALEDYKAKMEATIKKIYEVMKDGKFKGFRGKVQEVIHWGIDKVRNTVLGNGTSKQPDKYDNVFVEIAKKAFRKAAEASFTLAKEATSPPKFTKKQLREAYQESLQALKKLQSHVPLKQIQKWKKSVINIRNNGDEQLTSAQITQFQVAQREAMPGILNFIIKNNLVNEELASQEFRRYHGKDSRYQPDRNLEAKAGKLLRFVTRISPNDHPYRSLLSFMPWGIGAHLHTYRLKDGTIITPKSYWETANSGVQNQSKLDRANRLATYGSAGTGLFMLSVAAAPLSLASKLPFAKTIPGLRTIGKITPWILGITKNQTDKIYLRAANRALKKGASQTAATEIGKKASKSVLRRLAASPLGRLVRIAAAIEGSIFITDILKQKWYGNEQVKIATFAKKTAKKVDAHLRTKFATQLAKPNMTLDQLKLNPKVQEEMIRYTNSLPEIGQFKARILHDAVEKYRGYFQAAGMNLNKLAPGAEPATLKIKTSLGRETMLQRRTLLELVNLLNYEFAKAGLIGYGMKPYPVNLVAKEMTLNNPRPNYFAYKELLKHQIASGRIQREDLRHLFRLAFALQNNPKNPADRTRVTDTAKWLETQNVSRGRITQASIEAQGQENLSARQRRGKITIEKKKNDYLVYSYHTFSTKFKKLPKGKLSLPGISAKLTESQARRLANLKHKLLSQYPRRNAEKNNPFYVDGNSLYFALAAGLNTSSISSFIHTLSGKDVKLASKSALRRCGLKTTADLKSFAKILNKNILTGYENWK